MKIAIIDLDSVAFSCGHPNKVLDSKGEPIKENGKFVYIDKTEDELKNSCHYWMNDILTKSQATHYIAFIKGKGNYRYTIKSDYKSNRPKGQPTWWSIVKEYLISEFKAIEVNGIEVDDAVNITRLSLQDSFTCAIDGDLLGLEGNHYNWRKEEWIYTTLEDAYIKFWSDMITGQSGDGIKGIPGKGKKAVEDILKNSDMTKDPKTSLFRAIVLENYIGKFGEYIGIEEFYKNYKCLYILDKHEGFIIPEPISVK